MSKALGYVRVSTEQQAREGLSPEAQRHAIQEYCKGRGLPPPAFYEDMGISGKIPLVDRTAGGRLVGDLRPGDHLVVMKMDRAFRGVTDFRHWLDQWARDDINVHVINFYGNTIDPRTAMGRMFYTFLAAFAEYEREMISERIKEAYAELRRLGRKWAYFQHKPGERLVKARHGKGYVSKPHPEERKLMGQMLAWYEAGWSADAIRQHLAYTLKIPPIGRQRLWTPLNVMNNIRAEIAYREAESGNTQEDE